MNSISRKSLFQPAATSTTDTTSPMSSRPTQLAKKQEIVKQRSPENVRFAAGDWSIVTRDDGAVLATASKVADHDFTATAAVTLVPPLTQTENVKTVSFLVSGAQFGAPQFKITPYIYETMDGDRVAFGNTSYPVKLMPYLDELPVIAALRPQTDWTHMNEPVHGNLSNPVQGWFTLRVVDSDITLEAGLGNMRTFDPAKATTALASTTTSLLSTSSFVPTTQAGALSSPSSLSAPHTGSSKGLSLAAQAGIGAGAGGLVLLGGVALALVYRKTQMKKRAEKTEAFKLQVLPSLNPQAFNSI